MLCRFRISAHRLQIERGRYQGIPPDQRLCAQCGSGEVENEIHFILTCPKFTKERENLEKIVSEQCYRYTYLDNTQKFIWLFACENPIVLKTLCEFISKHE